MRKRALKKKRSELEALLADRREALGELVLGMHVRQSWDEDLMARGAAEVREVEDSLAELDEEYGEQTDTSSDAGEVDQRPSDGPDQPAFETAEHTMEHDLPPADEVPTSTKPGKETGPAGPAVTAGAAAAALGAGKKAGSSDTTERPETPRVEPEATSVGSETSGGDADVESGAKTTPDPDIEPEPKDETPAPPAGKTGSDQVAEEGTGTESGARPAPAEPAASTTPAAPEPKDSGTPPATAEPVTGGTPTGKAAETSSLDQLAARLDLEEKEARTGVEAARAAARADARTETSAILESVERDRAGLNAALAAAAARIKAAETRAEEAEAAVARKEAENREAAAGWVRSQAAEIEADAALASEISATGAAAAVPAGEVEALQSEVTTLKAAVEAERQEKITAIAAAEARLREIETKAREAEAQLAEGAASSADSPSPAETREAAVDWLRGQIAALKKEIESSSERSGS